MIEKIEVADCATYGSTPAVIDRIAKFNYFFGANASGKTTISRVIADEDAYTSCAVTWKDGNKLDAMVYNRDFISRNFDQQEQLKGVFTLGEDNIEILKKIEDTRGDIRKIDENIVQLQQTLSGDDGTGGKRQELEALDKKITERCWIQKQRYDERFRSAFEGYRGSKRQFKDKMLQEWGSNTSSLQPLEDLERKARTLFEPRPVKDTPLPRLEFDTIWNHERSPILSKKIIGKDDVDIASMIKRLGNSDWVQQGMSFYEMNNMYCPFCQQRTTEAFAQSLREYFDDTFVADSNALIDLQQSYHVHSTQLEKVLTQLQTTPSQYLDFEALAALKNILESRFAVNRQRLATKVKEPSRPVELASIVDVAKDLQTLIVKANQAIADHNLQIANLDNERQILIDQIWRYLLEVELQDDLNNYKKDRDNLQKAIDSISRRILALKERRSEQQDQIQELERQTTSVEPTLQAINSLLRSVGFNGFFLTREGKASYKLVRQDGIDAKETLSEGERSFVTFLYFYYLLKGSDSGSSATADRIAVFDDPVSSLDSDILFIVTGLIKSLFDEVRRTDGTLKQVFVFTHNIYFHREVTFSPRRRQRATSEETFWIVRKLPSGSLVEGHHSNPIKSSYEWLWAEVRSQARFSPTIQNTLRRILENYFKIFGQVDLDRICDQFDGQEKLICRSLLAWVHAGSHYAHDDLYLSMDESMIRLYLTVFRQIFVHTGHEAHYDMMMGEWPTAGASATTAA